MAAPTIRPAETADLLSMSDVIERQLRKHVPRGMGREASQALLASASVEGLQRNIADGYQYHVLAAGDMLYGVVGMKPPCHLHHLFVADLMQRQGWGRKLWNAARDGVCLQHSVPPVFTVNAALNSVPFYRALGFDVTGEPQQQHGIPYQPMRYVMLGARLK
jgi:GNAT superfamily N-acetyltransferase